MRWCALLQLMMISSPPKVVTKYFLANAMIFLPWFLVGSASKSELTIVSEAKSFMAGSMPAYKLSHEAVFLG